MDDSGLLLVLGISLIALILALTVSIVVGYRRKQGADDDGGDKKVKPEKPSSNGGPKQEILVQNPVLLQAPDPTVVYDAKAKMYYAFVTGVFTIICYQSPDLLKWKVMDSQDLMPGSAPNQKWGVGSFWAPHVCHYDGKWYLLFSSASQANNHATNRIRCCVSSKGAAGPYSMIASPLVNEVGIDPFVLHDDDGSLYLYWSTFGNDSGIFVSKLASDFKSLLGPKKFLIGPQSHPEAWVQDPVNEGAWVLKHDGTYYLVYSGNGYTNVRYGLGYATSKSPMGPFIKSEDNPILIGDGTTNKRGIGHCSFLQTPGGTLLCCYHKHMSSPDDRAMCLDEASFNASGHLVIKGPSISKFKLVI